MEKDGASRLPLHKEIRQEVSKMKIDRSEKLIKTSFLANGRCLGEIATDAIVEVVGRQGLLNRRATVGRERG